jgi:hypothetical protein
MLSIDDTQPTAIRKMFPSRTYEIRSWLGDKIMVTARYNQKFSQYIEHIEISTTNNLLVDDEIPLFKF